MLGPALPLCTFPRHVPLPYGQDIWLEEPCCWALSARPMHSRASSDSILMIEGRVWWRAANSVASREVLPFGLGLEKLEWELWRATPRACLSTLSVATDEVRVGHSPARWRQWMDARRAKISHAKLWKTVSHFGCQAVFPLPIGPVFFFLFFLLLWSSPSLNLKLWRQL